MTTTIICKCPHCSGLLLAKQEQKTRTCPYCGKRIEIQKTKRVASAKDSFEASQMLKKIKAKKQNNPKTPTN
jgi:acetyl-CoA carboxylase beta subunit